MQLALGLALFELGRRVDLCWLWRERALLATALLGSVLGFAMLFWVLNQSGFAADSSAIIAAIALAVSPAALLEVIRETHAQGQVSNRMIAYAGLGNLLALCAFVLSMAYARFHAGQDIQQFIWTPAWQLLGSAAIGLCAGLASIQFNIWIGAHRREAQQVLLFGLIALTVGLCIRWKLLPAMALLSFGLSTINLHRGYTVSTPYMIRHSEVFFVALFVVTGSQLDLSQLRSHLYLAPPLVLLRACIPVFSGWICASANGLSRKNGALLGLGLMPMASGAGAILLLVGGASKQFGAATAAMIISMLCITELLGPILTRLALTLAGETHGN